MDNKKRRYLVIGDANSMHIYNYVKNVLLPYNYEIHLLTLSVLPIREIYRKFYKKNDIFIHSVYEKGYRNLDKKDRFHRTIQLVEKVRLMRDIPPVDICHVHSVYKTSLYLIRIFKKKYDKLILSYWGGDIEDTSRTVVKLRKQCFEKADYITVTVERTLEQFREIYGAQYDEKLKVCRFATEGLECIHSISEKKNRRECKKILQIPENKICITCGYSAYAEQRQDVCLEQIACLSEQYQEKIFVIVPMQYGRFDINYIKKVQEVAKKCKCDIKILEEYYSFEKSAMLALATDIYLHVRDTDAFSNALKEHIYSGNIVIKGDWLIYRELDDMMAKMISIESLSDINKKLELVLDNFQLEDEIKLFDPIYELYSVKSICEQWNEIIDSL